MSVCEHTFLLGKADSEIVMSHSKSWTSLVAQMVKASVYKEGDQGSIPGSRRSPGEGNGNPLQYSCLHNPMDGGVWWTTVLGVAELDTAERLHFTIVEVHSNWVHAAQDYPKRPIYTPFVSNI